MVEHQLIKLVLSKSGYEYLRNYVSSKLLSSFIRAIYQTIEQSHEQYQHDLTLDEVKAIYFSTHILSESKKELAGIVFEKIEQAEPIAQDVIKDVTVRLTNQKIAQEAVELLSPVVLGKEDSLDAARALLENAPIATESTDIETVSTSIEELIPMSMPENRYEFALPTLQERINGAGPGNFVIIFGRPEIGKSTFVAHNNIGYLNQGLKVSYFGNEEPGWKIMMNHIRSATGLSDAELQENYRKGIKSYDNWDDVKARFSLLDCVGMHISDIDSHIRQSKPDVIIVDQLDKVMLSDRYTQDHLRLKDLYVQFREVAKRNGVLVIGVSQASADAEGKRYPSFAMLDGSKTGKAGEADIIIGIGHGDLDGPYTRHLEISKNKITGWKGHITCEFLTEICRVEP